MRKLLLVDDEAIIAMSEARILKKHGFEVSTAYSGEKAVNTVDSDPEIALVLMDIDLGSGIDGPDAARQLLEHRDLPIVFLTSHAEKEYVDLVKKITGYGYVLKNSGEFVLIESINMAFQLYEYRQQMKAENEERKQAQSELTAIYEHTPVLMVLVNRELELKKANAFASRFAGSPAEKLLGTRPGEALRCIHHLDDPRGCGFGHSCSNCSIRNIVLRTFAEQRGFNKIESHLPVMIEGTEQTFTFMLSTAYIELKDEPHVIISMEDITERKRAEDEVKASEDKYRTIYENAPIPYQSLSPEGYILDVNPAWEVSLGYERDEVIGQHFSRYILPEEKKKFNECFSDFKRRGKKYNVFFTLIRKNGEQIVVLFRGHIGFSSNGEMRQTHCVFQDVTEYKAMEQRFKENEEYYRHLYHSLPVMSHSIDSEGKIIDVSEKWLEVLGYSRDEVIGTKSVEFLTPESKEYAQKQALPNFFKTDRAEDVQYRFVKKSGETIDVLISAVSERDRHGEFIKSLAVLRELSSEETLHGSTA